MLLQAVPSGTVMLSSWLSKDGYSLDLQKAYRRSNWLKTIGTGAMIRTGDNVGYLGAMYALQTQSGLNVHPAGRTALAIQGKEHYLSFAPKAVTVFGELPKLPTWFVKHEWDSAVDYHQTSFLPADLGLTEWPVQNFHVKISTAVRAIMECLYLAPGKMTLMECLQLMEGLNNAKPAHVQRLLEECTSVKVKRLFLYLAEKADHSWLKYVNLQKIDLGAGNRSIVKNGVYISRYQITVPKDLAEYGNRSI